MEADRMLLLLQGGSDAQEEVLRSDTVALDWVLRRRSDPREEEWARNASGKLAMAAGDTRRGIQCSDEV
jgi:hypothetical protein